MSQLRHIHRATSVFFLLFGVSAVKVQQLRSASTPPVAETHQQPLSLNKWGLKGALDLPAGPEAFSWSKQPELDMPPSLATPAPNDFLALSSSATTSGNNTLLLATALLWVLVTIFFVVILGGGSENESGEEAPEVPVAPSSSLSPRATCHLPVEIIDAYSPRARNAQVLSEQRRKDALELCLRCQIFLADDYSNNRISQEHVDECLWIASKMLQQMPFDSWVDLSERDRQSFEDSVDAILQAMPVPPAFGTLDVRATAPVPTGFKKPSPTTSSVSLSSEVSFKVALEPNKQAPVSNYAAAVMTVAQTSLSDQDWAHLQDTRPLPEKLPARLQDTRPLPEKTPVDLAVPDKSPGDPPADKSPVPLMNCGDQAEIYTPPSSTSSTHAGEDVFSSIFGGSSADMSPQHSSRRSSPLENSKIPSSGFTIPSTTFSTMPNSPCAPNSLYEKVPSLRLSTQEVLGPPLHSLETPGSGRQVHYDRGSPRGLLESASPPSGFGCSFSPRGNPVGNFATSTRKTRPGGSSIESRIPLLSETPDLAQNQRLPQRAGHLS